MKIAETPATDSESIIGRVVEVPVSELVKDQAKYYMNLHFKVDKLDGNNASSIFHCFDCVAEYVMRMSRKGLGKCTAVLDVVTKDGWKLQVTVGAMLNRKGNIAIKKKISTIISEIILPKSKEMNHDDFIKAVLAGVFQVKIKKTGSKVYPIRFCEVTKIEAMKVPQAA